MGAQALTAQPRGDRLQRIRSWLAGELAVATPRPAATVILLRDSDAGIQTFLMRRAATLSFAPGALVFPGGAVETGDGDPIAAWTGPLPAQWAAWLGCDAGTASSLLCAAVRETFEECDVLIAGPPDGPDAARLREALAQGSFTALLNERGWALRSELLRPWMRWVTPEFSATRYDTYFFLATVPDGQLPVVASSETDDAAWYSVPSVLDEYRRGSQPLALPTAAALRDVARLGHLDAVLREWRTVSRFETRPVMVGDAISWVVSAPDGDHPVDEFVA